MQGYIREIIDNSNLSLNGIISIIVQYRAAKLNAYPADCILFGVGDNDSGRIGDIYYDPIEYLTPLRLHKDFKHIFIGPEAVFSINTSNTVYVTGEIERERNDYVSGLFDDDSDSDFNGDDVVRERGQPLSADVLASKQINLVSQGSFNGHCFFYDSKERKLWANGSNDFGQFGNGKKGRTLRKYGNLELVPMPWDSTKIQLIDIRCKVRSTLFLTDDGSVWSCGSNHDGTLGIGEFNKDGGYMIGISTITRIEINLKITKIACSEDICVMLGVDGNLYVFGSNYYGALGMFDDAEHDEYIQWTPTVVPYFKERGIKIVDFDCGEHTCCLDYKNNVYLWGRNERNQCGNAKAGPEVRIPMKLDLTPFHPANEAEIIQSVHCGVSHTVLLTVKGNLFVWGDNGSEQCVLTPYDVIEYENSDDEDEESFGAATSEQPESECIAMLDDLIALYGQDIGDEKNKNQQMDLHDFGTYDPSDIGARLAALDADFDEMLHSRTDPTVVWKPRYISRENIVTHCKSQLSESYKQTSNWMIVDVLCGFETTFLVMKPMKN